MTVSVASDSGPKHTTDSTGGVVGSTDSLLRPTKPLFHLPLPRTHCTILSAPSPTVAPPPPVSLIYRLPKEIVHRVLSMLDGHSLLTSAHVCRTFAELSYDHQVWQKICRLRWPSLRLQLLPQLPGAPDYDLVRLYGGSWRTCFQEQHKRNVRAECSVRIDNFAKTEQEKIISDTFAIGEHHFCLWIFPRGNPNELQYAGKALSVYLVLTDLSSRPPDWLTCAVFSLAVENVQSESKRLAWHSSLQDNKFDRQLNNWGVHSLGALSMLHKPENGYVHPTTGALTITAHVRVMTITFRVLFERHLKRHHELGLVDLTQSETLELPFCCTLNDLITALCRTYNLHPTETDVWCFNQPIASGQALRPRKLLTHPENDPHRPLFGKLLADGVDIDAYSFCQIYVEDKVHDDLPLEPLPCQPSSFISEKQGFVFVKTMNVRMSQIEYLGRFYMHAGISISSIYDVVAQTLETCSADMTMVKEEIAPKVISTAIPYDAQNTLQVGDILIFLPSTPQAWAKLYDTTDGLLDDQYSQAQHLAQHPIRAPTLGQIETLAEKLDMPKFRVRSAFRKCQEDGRKTLEYIMEGRHLGFICDSCGITDFQGPRYNCLLCNDYDLCHACHDQMSEIGHRYANVNGTWERVYNFTEHTSKHPMREMLPVFFQDDDVSDVDMDYPAATIAA